MVHCNFSVENAYFKSSTTSQVNFKMYVFTRYFFIPLWLKIPQDQSGVVNFLSIKIIIACQQIFGGGGEGYYKTHLTGLDAIRLVNYSYF